MNCLQNGFSQVYFIKIFPGIHPVTRASLRGPDPADLPVAQPHHTILDRSLLWLQIKLTPLKLAPFEQVVAEWRR